MQLAAYYFIQKHVLATCWFCLELWPVVCINVQEMLFMSVNRIQRHLVNHW